MDTSDRCDWCGDVCDGGSEANSLSCTYGQCEGGIYHQECLYQFLRANKLEKNRKTGFKCPRGCGKGTRYPAPCPGRIDKSHPYIPRNEEKFKKRQLQAVVEHPKPPRPEKHAEKAPGKGKHEEDTKPGKAAKTNGAAPSATDIKLLNPIGKAKDKAVPAPAPAKITVLNRPTPAPAPAPAKEKPVPAAPSAWTARPSAAAVAVAVPPAVAQAAVPDTSGDSDVPAPAAALVLDLGAIPVKQGKRKARATPVNQAPAPHAAASPARTAAHHSHTNSALSTATQDTVDTHQDAQFPPMPPTAAPRTPSVPVPTSRPPSGAGAAAAAAGNGATLSTAGSLTSNGLAADLAGQDADDEEDECVNGGGKGLSKAQRKNLKRQEKKKRQASMSLPDPDAHAVSEELHDALDTPSQGLASAGAHTPRTTQSGAVTESSCSAAAAMAHLAANAAHLLDDNTTQSSPSQVQDDDPLHLLMQHEQQQLQHDGTQLHGEQQDQQQQHDKPDLLSMFKKAAMHAGPPATPSRVSSQAPTFASWANSSRVQSSRFSAAGLGPSMVGFGVPPPELAVPLSTDPLLEEQCVHALVGFKCRRLFAQLLHLGFQPWQAVGAVQACGAAPERAVQWLLDRVKCGPQQLSAAAAAGSTPEVDISVELRELAAAQAGLRVRTELLYQTVIDLGGDVAAAVSMVAQQLNADPHHRHYSLLDPAHSLDTFYTAHSDLASLSRVHTAASELAWAFSGADGHAALAPRGGFEKAPVSPLGEAWRHGSGAGSARWSIDVVPGAAHGATGAGGAEGNGNGVYSNGHGLVPPHGMLGSTGAAWESHGSSSTADRRVSTGAGSHVAEESEVKSLLALMCR